MSAFYYFLKHGENDYVEDMSEEWKKDNESINKEIYN